MKVHLLLLLLCFSACSFCMAQKGTVNDSLWCDHLSEVIKSASIHTISERIVHVTDSEYIASLPLHWLTGVQSEHIAKQYNKVTYTAWFYTSKTIDEKLLREFNEAYKRLKYCLAPWEVARLKNADPLLPVPDDYFITNSEDETTLRLDIYKDPGAVYHVRLRIF